MLELHERMVKSDACPEGFDEEIRNALKVLMEKGIMGALCYILLIAVTLMKN